MSNYNNIVSFKFDIKYMDLQEKDELRFGKRN